MPEVGSYLTVCTRGREPSWESRYVQQGRRRRQPPANPIKLNLLRLMIEACLCVCVWVGGAVGPVHYRIYAGFFQRLTFSTDVSQSCSKPCGALVCRSSNDSTARSIRLTLPAERLHRVRARSDRDCAEANSLETSSPPSSSPSSRTSGERCSTMWWNFGLPVGGLEEAWMRVRLRDERGGAP